MKMSYEKPIMDVQQFQANEFCSSCGDSGTHYLFECNANRNGIFTNGGFVYQETNGKDGLQSPGFLDDPDDSKFDQGLGNYAPCQTRHVADRQDEFLDGYLTNIIGGGTPIPVKIWRGEDGKNIHCTTNIEMEDWETLRS